MRNRQEVNIHNVYVGMRIKVALPRIWCQVRHTSPIVWVKGRIVEIERSKKNPDHIGIVFNFKWNKHHHYFKMDRMLAFPKEGGVFTSIYKCK